MIPTNAFPQDFIDGLQCNNMLMVKSMISASEMQSEIKLGKTKHLNDGKIQCAKNNFDIL